MDDVDNPPHNKIPPPSQTLETLTHGPLAQSLTALTASSKTLPSSQDFHFYNNFPEFKIPVKQIAGTSQSLLVKVGDSSRQMLGKAMPFEDEDEDDDVGYDWVVNVNDEVYERFDASKDEFEKARKGEEDGGFQLVYGKKKSKAFGGGVERGSGGSGVVGGGRTGLRDKKGRVQFHISSIRKPQEEFNILVNNSNEPFRHVWLETSEDGQRLVHPLEKLSVFDFVDKDVDDLIPVKPPSMEDAPFKLVEDVKDLKQLAAKLRAVSEFAVDLEHNQYRSFQGLTCLMQISTRTEDFIVDTLKLKIHVGPHLREVFKDPMKKKVMHGADRDIKWLQRDFGIYVCNLFDTGQASRILKLERNSLEYLLHYFCGVTANKEYQNADWRLRPLPDEMLRYAREDTHYLLYIYDLMRIQLFSMPKESVDADDPLVEVYKRSYDICMQLYEKEILTEDSYLYLYGLQGARLNAQQLAIVAGLYEWRDAVARSEDESTGYILPNKSLIEIAKQMPVTTSQLRWLLKSKHPYVERNLSSVVSIIRQSMQNAAAFEGIAERLKDELVEAASKGKMMSDDAEKEISLPSDSIKADISPDSPSSNHKGQKKVTCPSKLTQENQNTGGSDQSKSKLPSNSIYVSGPLKDENKDKAILQMTKDSGATIQVLKKPSGAFGALLGNSASKRKLGGGKKDKKDIKLEQIRSSVNLRFHSFEGSQKQEEGSAEEQTRVSEVPDAQRAVAPSKLEDIIVIEDDEDDNKSSQGDLQTTNEDEVDNSRTSPFEMDKEDEPVSLNELSSSFQKCFQSMNQTRKSKQVAKPQESKNILQLTPFDYESATQNVQFGDSIKSRAEKNGGADPGSRKKASKSGLAQKNAEENELRQGKRRQAFPASGNRSATFR